MLWVLYAYTCVPWWCEPVAPILRVGQADNMDMASFDFDNMQNLDIMALFEWGNFGDQKEADLGKSNIRVQPSWGCACSGGCPHSHCCYHPPQLADS